MKKMLGADPPMTAEPGRNGGTANAGAHTGQREASVSPRADGGDGSGWSDDGVEGAMVTVVAEVVAGVEEMAGRLMEVVVSAGV